MRVVRLVLLTFLAFPLPAAAAAQEADIVVRGDVARHEVERILDADNVDTSRLTADEVAETIAAIERGRAPEDFWAAYHAHVRAWQRLAEAEARLLRQPARIEQAEQAIEATFDEVERIARSYGARLPTPPGAVAPTV
ncbi:MAG: hypothetical protein ABIW83_01680 [Allosphingosinicella sp.]